jgi:hypothetical protein
MFGHLISSAIKIATLPVDAASSAMDIATGGDGSKLSRTDDNNPSPFSLAERLRDKIAEAAEAIDK